MLQQPRGDAGAAQGRGIEAVLVRGLQEGRFPLEQQLVSMDNPVTASLRGEERLKDQTEHRATGGFSN